MNKVSVFLDVALSLTFFYLIASMFVSGITEFINTLFEKRSKLLWEAIAKLQDSWASDQKEAFQDHPLVKFFEHEKGKVWSKATSYIHANTFVSVVLDKIGIQNIVFPIKPDAVDSLLNNLDNGDFKKVLTIFLKESKDLNDFKKQLSNWFDLYMAEVSGWYKRYTRIVIWIVAIIVSISLNLNSIKITKSIYLDPILRDSMVSQALKAAKSQNFKTFEQGTQEGFLKFLQTSDSNLVVMSNADSSVIKPLLVIKASNTLDSLKVRENYAKYLQQNLSSLGLPMGWGDGIKSIDILSFIGWILTAAALSFGAPFWFDLLLKIVNIRNVSK